MTDQSVRIIEAALRLYMKKPPHEVSIGEIAREAKVSKGLVFYHFESKQKLLEEAVFMLSKKCLRNSTPAVRKKLLIMVSGLLRKGESL